LLLVVEFSQCVTDNNSLPQVYRNLPNKTPTDITATTLA
jgi:hypothetical protein